MTINAPAVVLLAFYVVAAERRGIAPERAGAARSRTTCSRSSSRRRSGSAACGRTCASCATCWSTARARMPRWNTISVSGYHIREAGATAVQELAFTLADGIGYVELGREAGLDVDDFAPRLSFFWDVHNDFFEEIAKLRAARRMWARIMRERFGAKNPRSWLLRAHAQTAGVSLVAQQPLNNVVRTDLPGAGGRAGRHAVAAHQLLRRDLRAADRGGGHAGAAHAADPRRGDRASPAVADPLGGSYFVEALTDRMEAEAEAHPADHRRDGRHRARGRGGLAAARDRRARPTGTSARSTAASARWSASTGTSTRGAPRRDPDLEDRRRARSGLSGRRWPSCGRGATRRGRASGARRRARAPREGDGNLMDAVLEAARRDATLGRDLSGLPRRVRRISRPRGGLSALSYRPWRRPEWDRTSKRSAAGAARSGTW